MYKYIMIIAVILTMFLGGCAPKNYAVAGDKIGLPFGTILTIGGQKMIVVSQETQETKLKLYNPIVKNELASVTGIKAEDPSGIKPEWESKKVVTEGVKTVQECHDPRGCPQDVKTGECLEGCSEQKVQVKMTETIIEPGLAPKPIAETPSSDTFDPNLVLYTLFRFDGRPDVRLRSEYRQYYGQPEWICVMINYTGTTRTKILLTKLLHTNPKLVQICDAEFPSNGNLWNELPKQKRYNQLAFN